MYDKQQLLETQEMAQGADHPDISPVVGDTIAVSTGNSDSGSTITASSESRLALLRVLLDSVTPSLVNLFPVITDAGLSTDAHLEQYFQMLPTSKDKFLREALSEKFYFV